MKVLRFFFIGLVALVAVLFCKRSGTAPSPTLEVVPVAQPFQQVVVHDTIVIVKQEIKYIEKSDYTKTNTDKNLLKKADVKPKEVLLEARVGKQITDSVKPVKQDSVLRYSDPWADIRYHFKDSTFLYKVRDSVNIYITKRYKHKFLFLKWGKKSYDVVMVNHNPNSTISFLSSVAVK